MKVCRICNIEKELINFYKRKNSKDGYRNECKECCNLKSKLYSERNKSKVKEIKYRYYKNNKDIVIERSKLWSIENSEKRKEHIKKYYNKEEIKLKNKEKYINNKDYFSNKNKEYKSNNKEKINLKHREKYKNDNLYKLSFSCRNLINKALIRHGYLKESKTTDILGCSFEDFKLYLESKFEDWMTWENRGLYNGEFNYGWDIDHIIPISFAKTEEDIIKLNHYTNLQPLCSKINRDIKKDKLDYGIISF